VVPPRYLAHPKKERKPEAAKIITRYLVFINLQFTVEAEEARDNGVKTPGGETDRLKAQDGTTEGPE
jgi:hypothetical protein